ncbi:MAG: hypothetical protein IT355_12815 [Gemmatimonadaceae bacterium]|nr:hypothetical protein [Gemmatimonadaceae bacterium]
MHATRNGGAPPHHVVVSRLGMTAALVLAMLLPCAASLRAQAAAPDSMRVPPGPRDLAAVQSCPRAQCELTLERGTVHGTRLRVGHPGSLELIGFTGRASIRRLQAVPAAGVEAARARSALRRAIVGTVATLLADAAIWVAPKYLRDSQIQQRWLLVAAISSAGVLNWQYQTRGADGHFERAVTNYNRELPP